MTNLNSSRFCILYLFSALISPISAHLDVILSSDVFLAHEVSADMFHSNDEDIESNIQSISPNVRRRHHPLFLCSKVNALKELRTYIHEISGVPLKSIRTVVIRRSADLACLLVDSTVPIPLDNINVYYPFSRHILPDILKIDRSVISYLERRDVNPRTQPVQNHGHHHYIEPVNYWGMEGDGRGRDMIELVIEFSPFAMGHKSSREIGLQLFKLYVSPLSEEPYLPTKSQTWNKIMAEAIKMSDLNEKNLRCDLPESVIIEYFHTGLRLRNLVEVTYSCIVFHVHRGAWSSDVLRVAIGTKSKVTNFEARGMVESGLAGHEPYRKLGLTGKGQVCGLADTGVNDMSCFFRDDSNAYDTRHTVRSGEVEALRRKVIQYVGAADSSDYEGGHGTHVAGTLLGSSKSDFRNMDGVAPDAKLAFFDIGKGDKSLTVPSLFDIVFPAARKAGARVHSNSWGASYLHSYNYNSYDVDRYTYEHPDFLVILAAGNYGENGPLTIITPADAKNGIAVGALEKHDPMSDLPLQELTVAWFSSRGPAVGGRFKPDIIAPGSVIMSTFASAGGSVGMSYFETGPESCALHAMMGTSMSTPVVAGTALLIRQYFMDAKFWAANCNAKYKSCADGAFTPSGYLLKALLLHSAEPATQYSVPSFNFRTAVPAKPLRFSPDSEQGYGSIRLSNILPLSNGEGLHPEMDLLVWDGLVLREFESLRWDVQVRAEAAYPLKATVAWYDPPATLASAAVLLLHDIDLLVVGPDGAIHYGNGIWGGDELNPNERVLLSRPVCAGTDCTYRVFLHAHSLPESDDLKQSVALVITCAGAVSGPFVDSSYKYPGYRTRKFDVDERTFDKGSGGDRVDETAATPLNREAASPKTARSPLTEGKNDRIRISVNVSLQPARFYSLRSRVQCLVNGSTAVSVSISKDVILLPAVLHTPVSRQDHLQTTVRADTSDGAYGLQLEWYRLADERERATSAEAGSGVFGPPTTHNDSDYHLVVSLFTEHSCWKYLWKHSVGKAVKLHIDEFVAAPASQSDQFVATVAPEVESASKDTFFSKQFVNVDLVLRGEEYWETVRTFPEYWVLNRFDVRVAFNPLVTPNRFSTVSDLIFGILAPNGVKLVVSGTPEGLRWPFDWYKLENGTFRATFYVGESNAAGAGVWTFGFRNSYSLSGDMSYVVGITMYCSSESLPRQNSRPSSVPTSMPTRFESTSSFFRRVVPIPSWTPLGVRTTEHGALVQDSVQLATFSISDGYLREVHIALQFQDIDNDKYRAGYIDGSTAWLFTIIVTDPRGFSVQIGGRDFWGTPDKFFKTDWPLVWAATFPGDHIFEASRDVSAAGLNAMGTWTVTATMGYPEAVAPKNFAGDVTLLFATTPDAPLTLANMMSGQGSGALGFCFAVASTLATFGALLTVWQRNRRSRYVLIK